MNPLHPVRFEVVPHVVDAASGDGVVLHDQLGEAEVGSEDAEADEIAVDGKAGRLDYAVVLAGQEMGVDTPGINSAEDPFPFGSHRELAGRRRFGRKSGAVSDPLPVIGPGQIPAELKVVPVEGSGGADPGVPFLVQRDPFLTGLGTLLACQANPRRQGTSGFAPRLLQRSSQRLFGGRGLGPGNLGLARFDGSGLGFRSRRISGSVR